MAIPSEDRAKKPRVRAGLEWAWSGQPAASEDHIGGDEAGQRSALEQDPEIDRSTRIADQKQIRTTGLKTHLSLANVSATPPNERLIASDAGIGIDVGNINLLANRAGEIGDPIRRPIYRVCHRVEDKAVDSSPAG